MKCPITVGQIDGYGGISFLTVFFDLSLVFLVILVILIAFKNCSSMLAEQLFNSLAINDLTSSPRPQGC